MRPSSFDGATLFGIPLRVYYSLTSKVGGRSLLTSGQSLVSLLEPSSKWSLSDRDQLSRLSEYSLDHRLGTSIRRKTKESLTLSFIYKQKILTFTPLINNVSSCHDDRTRLQQGQCKERETKGRRKKWTSYYPKER